MAAEEEEEFLLNLFDSCWFEYDVLSEKPPSQLQAIANPCLQVDQLEEADQEEAPNGQNFSCLPILKVRSLSSDQYLSTKSSIFTDSSSFSPPSVLLGSTPKLHAILSGKEFVEPSREKKVHFSGRKRTRRRVGPSKSMSELEFDELKGFMDLGFVFTEEDKDSKLVSIIPGLQRLGSIGEQEIREEDEIRKRDIFDPNSHVEVSRPYLSEAWDVLDQRKKENQLMNWRLPASLGKDMKHHLKFWAHTVASTVR